MYNIFIYLLHNHRCITAGDIHKCVCFSNYNDQPIITKLYETRPAFHLKSYHHEKATVAIYSPPPVTSRAIRRRKKLWLKPYLFNSTRYLVVYNTWYTTCCIILYIFSSVTSCMYGTQKDIYCTTIDAMRYRSKWI